MWFDLVNIGLVQLPYREPDKSRSVENVGNSRDIIVVQSNHILLYNFDFLRIASKAFTHLGLSRNVNKSKHHHSSRVNTFSTLRAKNKKESSEKQTITSITMSIACNDMYGLRKNTIAIAALCHTFSCANAPSCFHKFKKQGFCHVCFSEKGLLIFNVLATFTVSCLKSNARRALI